MLRYMKPLEYTRNVFQLGWTSFILKQVEVTASSTYWTTIGQDVKQYFSDLDSIDKKDGCAFYLVGSDI